MTEDKDLDEIFEQDVNTDLTKVIRNAKWRSNLRTAAISVVVSLIVWAGGATIINNYTYSLEAPVQIAVSDLNRISAPDRFIGTVTRYHDALSGKNTYSTYKIIEGKVVYTGQGEYSYSLFGHDYGNRIGSESPLILWQSQSVEDLNLQRYNDLGQREMVFFYPFIKYQKYKNDLSLLNEIGDNKLMEVALSFDQAYSVDEVKKLLPKDVTLTWYWVDDLNEKEKAAHKTKTEVDGSGNSKVLNIPDVRSERSAYGIKLYNENGEPAKQPENDFIRAVINGKENDTRFRGEFQRIFDNLAGSDAKLTKSDLKIQGVVVTGSRQRLETLKGLSFIEASSLGVVTERY